MEEWPSPGGQLLYGFISDRIHVPGMWRLLMGDKTPPDVKALWEALALRYGVELEVVDEESAASGELDFIQ